MGIYRVFSEKDATIYSEKPNTNTGIDEILEVNAYKDDSGTSQVARTLIKFSQSDINNVLNNIISGSFQANLHLYLATAEEVPSEFTVFVYPLSSSWEMGLGRLSNTPETNAGVTWTTSSLNNLWPITGSIYYVTPAASQSFVYNDEKDLEINVTNIISAWTSSITNQGFLLKHSSSLEWNTSSNIKLKYFSQDTHTIYPPCLEFKWNDISYTTGSTVSNSNVVVSLINNKATYNQSSVQKFKLSTRDKFPTRVFQTSSVYLNTKLLPSTSYWGIRDLNTREMVVDFDNSYTKIGSDGTNNYFWIYCSGLEPERYYEVLIKSEINGETVIFDQDNYFKIIK